MAPRRSLRQHKAATIIEADRSDSEMEPESKEPSSPIQAKQRTRTRTKIVSEDDTSEPDIDIAAVVSEAKQPKQRKAVRKPRAARAAENGSVPDSVTLSDDVHMSTLYKSVVLSQTAMKQIVREWCERYNNDHTVDLAKCELLNLLIQCSGSTDNVTVNELLDNQITTMIRTAEESLRKPSTAEVQSKRNKRVENRMRDFWFKFTELIASTGILYNDDLLYYTFNVLSAITASQIRDFRRVGTQNAVHLMDTLCELTYSVAQHIEIARAQFTQAEGTAKKQLQVDMGKNNKKYEYLSKAIKQCFDSIFVHRYRDVEPSIRSLCLTALSHWINTLERIFLSDTYLKYLGWSLNDKQDMVRLAAIQAVSVLYEHMDEKKQSTLSVFTNKFKPRINEMINDKNVRVVVLAIDTLCKLLHHNYLDENDAVQLPQLLFDKERDISAAAARFIYEDTFSESASDSKSYLQHKEDVNQLLNIYEKFCPQVHNKQNTLITMPVYQSFEIVVSNFYNKLPFFEGLSVFFEMLGESSGKRKKSGDSDLSDHRQMLVLHLLYATVKHALKTQDTESSEQHENILIIIQHVNELLSQYQNDSNKLVLLYQLLQLIQPDLYVTLRKKQELTALLKLTKIIYMKHHNTTLLSQIAAFLRHYSTSTFQYSSDVDTVCTNIYEQLNEHLLHHLDSTSHSDDDYTEFLSVLKRFHSMYQAINNELFDFDRLSQHITQYTVDTSSTLSVEVFTYLLKIEFLNLRWNWQVEATNLSDLLHAVLDHYITLFSSMNQYEILDLLYTQISDIFVMFNPSNTTQINQKQYIVLQNHFTKYFTNTMSGKYINARQKNSKQTIDQSTLLAQMHQFALRAAIKPILYCIDPVTTQTKHYNLACQVASHYTKWEAESDELIKLMLSDLRKMSLTGVLQVQLGALKHLYDARAAMEDINKLSSKFALLLSFSKSDNRAFAQMLKDGIAFSMHDPPSNIPFLDALEPFLNRASEQEIRAVSAYFVQKSAAVERLADDSADWSAVKRFKDNIKKQLTKKYNTARTTLPHGTPLQTPRTITSTSPITTTLTPAAPSTAPSIRQRVPETIAESDAEEVEVEQQRGSKKRGRTLHMHSESETDEPEAAPRRSSGRKPAPRKRGKTTIEEESEEEKHDSE